MKIYFKQQFAIIYIFLIVLTRIYMISGVLVYYTIYLEKTYSDKRKMWFHFAVKPNFTRTDNRSIIFNHIAFDS